VDNQVLENDNNSYEIFKYDWRVYIKQVTWWFNKF